MGLCLGHPKQLVILTYCLNILGSFQHETVSLGESLVLCPINIQWCLVSYKPTVVEKKEVLYRV